MSPSTKWSVKQIRFAAFWMLAFLTFSCSQEYSPAARAKALQGMESFVVPDQKFVESGDAVFFVGNSFLSWRNRSLPDWVAALGSQMHPPVLIETDADIVYGNLPLEDFLDHPKTRLALDSRKYDVFVLQGEEYEPVFHKERFHQAVRDFHDEVTAAGGRIVLFMTWEFIWEQFIGELAASYDEIGRELGVPVIPAGLIYADCHSENMGAKHSYWLTADARNPDGGLHQNAMGTAVNTYATFAMLTGVNPDGMNFDAPGNSNDSEMMKHLSAMAWSRVRKRLPR